jgi:hypothetical protein
VDVVIELLHALGVEPLAVLGSTVAVDFEGDNFTFYKPDHDDLRRFYGVDIQELNVWLRCLSMLCVTWGRGSSSARRRMPSGSPTPAERITAASM